MSKHTSAASKGATWRKLLARQLASGKSTAAFCCDEAISEGNFHAWRSRLRTDAVNGTPISPTPETPFIDLGDGIALTITRH